MYIIMCIYIYGLYPRQESPAPQASGIPARSLGTVTLSTSTLYLSGTVYARKPKLSLGKSSKI